MEMGLFTGARLKVKRRSAFKGPLLIEVQGVHLGLRVKDAESIVVSVAGR